MIRDPFQTDMSGIFTLCTDPTTCPHVAAKSSVRVSYTDIGGYQTGLASIRITQWRIRRTLSGDYEAIDVQWADANIQQ